MSKIIPRLLILTILLIGQDLFAQEPFYEWHKTVGGEGGADYGSSVAVDEEGNIYVVGEFQDTIDLDSSDGVNNITSNGFTDVYIKKLDSDGNFLWSYSFGSTLDDSATSVVVHPNGGVYIFGSFRGVVDFNPMGVEEIVTPVGGKDVFLIKLGTNGNFEWVKTVGGNSTDVGADLYLGADDHLYSTGWFQNTADFDPGEGVSNLTAVAWMDCFIQKLDLDGNFVWAKKVGGPIFDEAHAVTMDVDGNVLVAGFFDNTVDFDPGIGEAELSSNGDQDAFVLKLDTNGDYVWAKSFGGTGSEDINDIITDSFGNVYTVGFFNNTVDFDTSIEEELISSNGGFDIFVHKLDIDGNFEWVKTYGSTTNDSGDVITVDNQDNLYVSGDFKETIDFNSSSDEGELTATPGFGGDAFFLKLNVAGEYSWVQHFEGEGAINFRDIHLDSNQNIFITGFFAGTNDLDPGSGVVNTTEVSTGQGDIFTLKLSPTCNQVLNSTETETVCLGDSFTFPDGTTEDNITAQVVYVSELQSAELCDSLVETTVNVVAIDTEITSFGSELTASESGTYQWLDCNNGNSEISGATSQSYTPSINGEYAVRITKNGCEAVSDCIAVNNVGLLENTLGTSVSVYPNPSSGMVYLDFGMVLEESTSVRIKNLLGQTVYEDRFANTKTFELYFEGSKGMYLLELSTESGKSALLPLVKE